MATPPHPVQLFSTDLDDTILGDPAAIAEFRRAWESLDAQRRPLLVYNCGRSVSDVQWLLLERRLPRPEFIIGGIGTQLHDPLDPRAGVEFSATLAQGWDPAAVEQIVQGMPGVYPQPAEYVSAYKRSWHWPRATLAEVAQVRLRLELAGLAVSVNYSGSVFLDVIPRAGGKGNALAWLCRRIAVPLEGVLVAGAGANNGSMFALPGVRGILVGNASRELFAAAGAFRPFLTGEKMAAGVMAGLTHFGVFAEPARMGAVAEAVSVG
jgi:sucrose-6F-phosphate phosphohydrolase